MGISRKEALDCLRSDDLIGIGMEADAVRRRLHPEGVVSYAVEAAIDCATVMGGGTRKGNQPAVGCVHRLFDEIGEAVERGSTGVRLVSGVGCESKGREMEWFEGMLRGVRQRFPSLWIEALSAAEMVALAAASGLDLRQTIARLRDAGMDSIACEDAVVNIGNRFARPQCTLTEWLAVHRAAHSLGMHRGDDGIRIRRVRVWRGRNRRRRGAAAARRSSGCDSPATGRDGRFHCLRSAQPSVAQRVRRLGRAYGG